MNSAQSSVPTEDRTAISFSLSDGRKLSYSKYGKHEGIPIIFHHGSPGSRISMDDPLFHEFGVEMIYPERPGYGNSSPHPMASFQHWADDVIALMDHLQIEQAHLGGGSGGSAFALACAAYHPDRFLNLSLIATAPPPQTSRKGMSFANRMGYFLNRYAPFVVRWTSKQFAKKVQRAPEKAWKQISQQLCPADLRILQKAKKNGLYQVFVDHLQEAFKQGNEGHVHDMRLLGATWEIPFHQIRCPISLWHGEDDTLAPIGAAKAFSTHLPNVQTHFFPGYGHLLLEEENVLREVLAEMRMLGE